MAPEFARFLEKTPEAERHGRVFTLVKARGSRGNGPIRLDTISEKVGRIGRVAGVVVSRKARWDRKEGKAVEKAKYASAHDFRRAFCFRWALRVKPAVLKDLARHASISTTEKYYIGQNSEAMADEIWRAWEAGKRSSESTRGSKRHGRKARPESKPSPINTFVNTGALDGQSPVA
jgi:integrase